MGVSRRVVTVVGVFGLLVASSCTDTRFEEEDSLAPAEDADPLWAPTEGDDLLAWLMAEPYLDWPSESEPHTTWGDHLGLVQTFVNPTLFESLTRGHGRHPVDSAAVMELYGDGDERLGWAVATKVADHTAAERWYLYKWMQGSVISDADGSAGCAVCHDIGGHDGIFVQVPFR